MPAKCVAVNRTGDQAGNPAPAPEAQFSTSLSFLPPMNAGSDSSDVRRGACCALRLCGACSVQRAVYCVLRVSGVPRSVWCVLRTAWCGFGLKLALLSQIASTCPQPGDRQASVAGSGATYTDMCAGVKLASD